MSIQNIPLDERPRERLWHVGEEALSDSELLAIILGSGTQKISVVELAQKLLLEFGGLAMLAEASLEELSRIHGVGRVKAIELRALFALCRRLLRRPYAPHPQIKTPQDAYEALADLFFGEKKERLALLLLNTKLQIIGREVIGIGTLTEVIVHPREVFLPAIKRGAHSLILAHNHPSNDPTPSDMDYKMTERLTLAGRLLDIEVRDHLVICNSSYYSLQNNQNSG